MIIQGIISKGQVAAIEFAQVNVTASQAAVALTVGGLSGGAVGKTQAFDGEIVSITTNLTAAATVGQLTAQVTINGVVKAAAQIIVTTAARAFVRIPRGTVKFVAGDAVGIKVTTNAGWNATSAGLDVTVGVLNALDGI